MTASPEETRLLAERACERLVYDYARKVDSGHASEVADLFTEDGVWTGAAGPSLEGRAAVRAAFTGREALARRVSRHVMTNVMVDVEGADEARGLAYLINYRHDSSSGEGELPAPARHPKFVGDYHLRFRRVDGRWLISDLRFDLVFLRARREPGPDAGTDPGS